MKLVELKCNICGAQLKVEEGTSQVKCEFCGSTFSVDDAYNEAVKTIQLNMINVFDLLNCNKLVLPLDTVKKLEEVYA